MEQISEYYVYEHARASDGRVFYVGKGRRKRAWAHGGRNTHWRNTVAKHGLLVEIVSDGLTEAEAFRIEQELLAHHRYHQGHERFHDRRSPDCVLTNLTDGGEGASGAVRSQESRQLQSKSTRGVPHSERHTRAISEALTGRTLSDDHKRAMSRARFGSLQSDYHRLAISKATRGVPKPWRRNPEQLIFARPATGERFELTRMEAKKRLNLTNTAIANLIAGRQKTARGFRLINA